MSSEVEKQPKQYMCGGRAESSRFGRLQGEESSAPACEGANTGFGYKPLGSERPEEISSPGNGAKSSLEPPKGSSPGRGSGQSAGRVSTARAVSESGAAAKTPLVAPQWSINASRGRPKTPCANSSETRTVTDTLTLARKDKSFLTLMLSMSNDPDSVESGPVLIKVLLGRTKLPALFCLDTGAGACYLTERIAKDLDQPCARTDMISFHAGGKRMDLIGALKVKFSTYGEEFIQNFVVARGLPVDGILGNSFSRKHVPLVLLKKGYAIFCNGARKFKVPIHFNTEQTRQPNYLWADQTRTLLPLEEALIPTKSDSEAPCANMRPLNGLTREGLLLTPFSIASPNDPKGGAICIRNISTQRIKVKKGKRLGIFHHPTQDRIALIQWASRKGDTQAPSVVGSNQEATDEHDWPIPGPNLLDEVDLRHLEDDAERVHIREIILEFRDRFDGSLGLTHMTEHSIRLKGDAEPILMHPYRMSPIERKVESKYIQLLITQKVVGPSNSPWGFPNVLVPKREPTPEDSHRVTTNFSRLNELTIRDAYPLPRVADAIDSLGGAAYFTILDANSGFFQIPMDENDQEKVTMTTHEGLFSYKRMPMGLVNSPATFQRLIDRVISGIKWRYCMAYMDDIAVYSKTFKEHLEHLRIVLQRFRNAGLTLRLRKCSFAKQSLRYLGYIISIRGWEVDPGKVRAIRQIARPESLKDVRSFLGMMGFFRMFIRDYAKIARPLTNLTRKEVRSIPKAWSEEHQSAFEALKEALTQAPILKFPDFEEPFILETDASKDQLGAVLMQKSSKKVRVTGFYSRKLSRAEENYSTTEKECLAVVWAVTQCCRPYLYGTRFTVITDHEALRWLLNLKDPHGRLARWALKLMNYDFEVVTRPGRFHSVPDALSRLPCREETIGLIREQNTGSQDKVMSLMRMPIVEDRAGFELPSKEEFRRAYSEDPFCAPILAYFENLAPEDGNSPRINRVNPGSSEQGAQPLTKSSEVAPQNQTGTEEENKKFEDYIVEDGVIYKLDFLPKEKRVLGTRIVVPRTLTKKIMEYYHCALPNGHMGMLKTYDRVRANYWWPGIQRDVYQYVSLCDTCLRVKQRKPPRQAYLKAIQPKHRFELVATDILKLNETHRGHKYVLIMTDMFSKFTKVAPLPDQSAITVAEALVDYWLSTFGAPEKLLTDRGSQFTGELFLSLCRLIGVKKIFTTPYHPQTDGVVERNNQTIIKMLSMYVATDQKNWDDILSMAAYAHNTAVHSTTGQTPYKMMFGVDAPDLSPEAFALQKPYREPIEKDSVERFRQALALAHELARKAMKKAQSSYKRHYDKGVIAKEFLKGDLVYLWQPSTKKEGSRKLTAPWRGPYRIKEKINELNVVLAIPTLTGETTARVHVNRLRKASEALLQATPLAIGPLHENLPEGHYFIDRLVGERLRGKQTEFRVRWEGYGRKHDTWEHEDNLPPIIVNEYRAMIRAKRAQRDASH